MDSPINSTARLRGTDGTQVVGSGSAAPPIPASRTSSSASLSRASFTTEDSSTLPASTASTQQVLQAPVAPPPRMSLTEFEKLSNSVTQRRADRSTGDAITSTLKTIGTIALGITALVATAAAGPLGWIVAAAGIGHLAYRHFSAQAEYQDKLWQEYDPKKLKQLVEKKLLERGKNEGQSIRFNMAVRNNNTDLQIKILRELDQPPGSINLEECRWDENPIGHAPANKPSGATSPQRNLATTVPHPPPSRQQTGAAAPTAGATATATP